MVDVEVEPSEEMSEGVWHAGQRDDGAESRDFPNAAVSLGVAEVVDPLAEGETISDGDGVNGPGDGLSFVVETEPAFSCLRASSLCRRYLRR